MLETLFTIGFATYGLATFVNHQPVELNIRDWVWLLLIIATGVILCGSLYSWGLWYAGLGAAGFAYLLLKLEDVLLIGADVLLELYKRYH